MTPQSPAVTAPLSGEPNMRSAPATHGRHTPPQPPLKGEGDRGAVDGFNKQERRLLLRKSNSYNDG